MAEAYQRQHALAYRALDGVARARAQQGFGMRMWPEPAAGQICLRGDANGRFAALVESVCGVPLPVAANTVSTAGDGGRDRRILWLGPDEWLAVCADDELHTLLVALHAALAGEHSLVSDVSHARVVIALEGEHARDVLCKGCSLDLDPVAFRVGQCAQTSLARAHMLLHQIGEAPRYHIYAQRSFAGYLYSWLEDAAREYTRPSP